MLCCEGTRGTIRAVWRSMGRPGDMVLRLKTSIMPLSTDLSRIPLRKRNQLASCISGRIGPEISWKSSS